MNKRNWITYPIIICCIYLVSTIFFNDSVQNPLCDGFRLHSDSIMVLVTTKKQINVILANLENNFPGEVDILLVNSEISMIDERMFSFSLGPLFRKKHNIRHCSSEIISLGLAGDGVTIWTLLSSIGYKWVMQIDDAFHFKSKLPYNIFDNMRSEGKVFGFRMINHDLTFSDSFVVTKVAWWLKNNDFTKELLSDPNSGYGQADTSNVIIRTSALQKKLEPRLVKHFMDWSYEYTQMRADTVVYSIFESGINDIDWQKSALEFRTMHERGRDPMTTSFNTCSHIQDSCIDWVAPCYTHMVSAVHPASAGQVGNMPMCRLDDLKPKGISSASSAENVTTNVGHVKMVSSAKHVVVMGMHRSLHFEGFVDSMLNLRQIFPSAVAVVGISKPDDLIALSKLRKRVHKFIDITILPTFVIDKMNRTSAYSQLRNLVYERAVRKNNLFEIDYLIVADIDMAIPISVQQWGSSFTFEQPWEVMTANGILDRTHAYYDVFAFRAWDVTAGEQQPLIEHIVEIFPKFEKLYTKSWHWFELWKMYDTFTRVRTAHGGLSIYTGDAWRRVVGDSNAPFKTNIDYDVCEHVPLQAGFHQIYVNPHLVYHHHSVGRLPFDEYKILVPRNGGFFSVFNFLIGHLALPMRVYPRWNRNEGDKRNIKSAPTHFSYLGDEDNAFLTYFEPIQYSEHDTTMISSGFTEISPHLIIISDSRVRYELTEPHYRPFHDPHFSNFRVHMNQVYRRFIRPKAKYMHIVQSKLEGEPFIIGVHLPNPIHFAESEEIYFYSYFEAIDKILESHPEAKIFVASDTEYALDMMLKRYGSRVLYYADFNRANLDVFLKVFHSLGSGQAKMDNVGRIRFFNESKGSIGGEIHNNRQSSPTQLGDEILLDALTLSNCQEYVGIESNIALAVSYINPLIRMHIILGLQAPSRHKSGSL